MFSYHNFQSHGMEVNDRALSSTKLKDLKAA